MADRAAEIPIQPEQKRLSVVDRVKGRLAKFWERVGPGSVVQEKMKTFQAVHEALGPGKAQDVLKMVEPVYKLAATNAGVVVMSFDIGFGVLTNQVFRRITDIFPNALEVAGGVVAGGIGMVAAGDGGKHAGVALGAGAGKVIGEVIRTPVGIGVGVAASELGVAHKMTGGLEKYVIRPTGVGIAHLVNRITHGWDTPPAEIKPAPAV